VDPTLSSIPDDYLANELRARGWQVTR
jgi:hypothetical protein